MAISASAATWFFLCALPICLWAAWSDLKYMKIPNKSVLALTVVFLAEEATGGNLAVRNRGRI